MNSSRRIALITGASSGLGLTFADRFASRGYDLVLVARRRERLDQVGARLSSRFNVATTALSLDLAQPSSWEEIADRIPAVDVVVNNAGFASFGDVVDTDPHRLQDQIMVNCGALTALTRTYLPGMLEQNWGAVVNIASTAAFQPTPTMAVYAATKAYVASFTAALWDEVKGSRVRVLGVCPGATQTGFFTAAGDETVLRNRRRPDQVVTTTMDALDRDLPLVVDGRGNNALAVIAKMTPTKLQTWAARYFVRPAHGSRGTSR